ncbi:MAG: nucleotidyltransferase domain-containing protein [Alphaproteobacteria bacterium]
MADTLDESLPVTVYVTCKEFCTEIPKLMSTSAERQRRRRARLRREGKIDVSVSVPYERRNALREYARMLNENESAPKDDDRLRTILRSLKSMKSALREAGVLHAGVFGSVARGDGGPKSDLDVLIDIDADRVGGMVKYIKICETVQLGLNQFVPNLSVDVVNQKYLKPGIREAVERDSIYAF